MSLLTDDELTLYATARSLVDWHSRYRYCSRCGHPTILAKGGWQRTCTNQECVADHFPRVDPVAIMIVERDRKLLLGRQSRFPKGRYTALSGFVEPGETVEAAVSREIFEETGVTVREVRYIASQSWPFPSSLMLACHALTDDTELTIDRNELEDARWFTRDEILAALQSDVDRPFDPPPSTTVARHLLDWWLRQPG